ncbi:MAG: hypothetical protein GXP06_08125 [Alphaproteobacteria bacterium]|nr:hypothetical protein [Alphaproteobacteria bacterium]
MLCKTAKSSRTLTNKRDIILDAAATLLLWRGQHQQADHPHRRLEGDGLCLF